MVAVEDTSTLGEIDYAVGGPGGGDSQYWVPGLVGDKKGSRKSSLTGSFRPSSFSKYEIWLMTGTP